LNHGVAYLVVLLASLALGICVTQLAMLVTTVYLHRHLAHRGVELRPEVRAASRVVLWITTALKPRQWARVHRHHHAFEDSADDPHSPFNFGGGRRGARYVLFHNGALYTRATHDEHLADKYRDLTADRWDHWVFDHGNIGLAFGVTTLCALMALIGHTLAGGWLGTVVGATAGLLAAGFHAASYLLAGGAVNGFGHANSTRRPHSGYTRNMPLIAWLTSGEGWHRNHHAAENSPRIGRPHQLDLGWLAIRALCTLRLAHINTRGAAGLQRLQTLHA
jgi:stearoyl-CoA desaturase (delta-9 desaturase)